MLMQTLLVQEVSMLRLFWLLFISIVFHLSFRSCQNKNLIRMWPMALALNYSVENIWNDIRQIMIMIIKSPFKTLMWGSHTLTPIIIDHMKVVPQSKSLKMGMRFSRLFNFFLKRLLYSCLLYRICSSHSLVRYVHILCNAIVSRGWLWRDHIRHIIIT